MVFFRVAPIRKVEKTRFEQNYTTLVNPALCAAWKSPPKMVVETEIIKFVQRFPRWGKSKKRVLNKIIRPSQPGFMRCLEKPTQNGGMKPKL